MNYCQLVAATTLGMALGLLPSSPGAQQSQIPSEPNGFTWGELAILPEYCRDTQGTVYPKGSAPRTAEWVGLMGEDFWHMHHYCYGMREILRYGAAAKTPQQRRAHLERAVNEYAYIVRNVSPRMILMPEVYLKIGEAYLLLGNVSAAQDAFAAARKLKPDYWPAYTKWIAVLASAKQYEAAAGLAKEGLAHAPDSLELQKAVKDLEQTTKREASKRQPTKPRAATAKAAAPASAP